MAREGAFSILAGNLIIYILPSWNLKIKTTNLVIKTDFYQCYGTHQFW